MGGTIALPKPEDVLWYGDPNKSYLDSFYRLSTEPGEAGSVSVETDAVFGKTWRVRKPAGSKRAELARTLGYVPAEGDKVYVGWRWKVAISGTANPGGFAIFQDKSDGASSQNYPLLMGYDGSNLSLAAYDPGSGSQASRGRNLWTKPVPEEQWVSLVLGIEFSRDASVGYVELWFDGKKQDLKGQGANQRVLQRTLDDNGNYFKWGAYNEASRPFDIVVHLDDMRVSKTYLSAEPNHYPD